MSQVPLHLLRYQLPMIWGVMQAFMPPLRHISAQTAQGCLTRQIAAPADALVDHYVAWSGADAQRYVDVLPPHLFSQWGIPLVTKLLLQTGYSLTGIINQGVTIAIHGQLPRHQPLCVEATLESVEEAEGKIRLAAHIRTGTVEQPALQVATLHMLLIQQSYKRRKSDLKPPVQQDWHSVGQWQADADDGFGFALLTGDFNPIHWIRAAGKRSPFRQMVLHGFGMFARSYEQLPNVAALTEVEVRFLRPVPLPSCLLSVQCAKAIEQADGQQHIPLRLIGHGNKVHMMGYCQYEA